MAASLSCGGRDAVEARMSPEGLSTATPMPGRFSSSSMSAAACGSVEAFVDFVVDHAPHRLRGARQLLVDSRLAQPSMHGDNGEAGDDEDEEQDHAVPQRQSRIGSRAVVIVTAHLGQDVAFAAARPNQRVRRAVVEFPSQALDVDVDHIRERIVELVPDVLGDVGPADDLAGVARQVLEQRVLARRQVDGAAARW